MPREPRTLLPEERRHGGEDPEPAPPARGEDPRDLENEQERARLTAPFENLLQEWLRRAAAAGFSSLRFTEEAIRRGLSDAMPPEWADFVSRQSVEVRSEMIDRFAREFGTWLRELDVERLLEQTLQRYQFRATIEVTTEPRARDESPIQAIARRR